MTLPGVVRGTLPAVPAEFKGGEKYTGFVTAQAEQAGQLPKGKAAGAAQPSTDAVSIYSRLTDVIQAARDGTKALLPDLDAAPAAAATAAPAPAGETPEQKAERDKAEAAVVAENKAARTDGPAVRLARWLRNEQVPLPRPSCPEFNLDVIMICHRSICVSAKFTICHLNVCLFVFFLVVSRTRYLSGA